MIAQHPNKGIYRLVRKPRNLVRAKSEQLSASDWNPCPRYPGTRNLDEALAFAGGIATPDFSNASIRIYRDQALYQIPMQDYLARPDMQKLLLQNGDSIFVDTAALLHKSGSECTSPFPGQIYPTASVTGMPRAV